ncbi:hypothetical protein [Tenacibaculum maritimum]
MKQEWKDCPKCGEKDGLETITVKTDMYIQRRILKCDTCSYQPQYGL